MLKIAAVITTALFFSSAFAYCPPELPNYSECQKSEFIKSQIEKNTSIDQKLEKSLSNALDRQKHEHLKSKITDSQNAYLTYIEAECKASSWKILQKILDDEGLAKIDQSIEESTVNQCLDQFKKERIKHLNLNY